ncbi:ROK family transcriptional regulator [Streptomyces sp. NPDC002851]
MRTSRAGDGSGQSQSGRNAQSGRSGQSGRGVNLPALRSHNAALVLDLLRTAGADGISRLELAERTGLTPQAVSKITARLRADGLAAEAGRRASTGGKPRTVLRLVPGAAHAVGLHLDRDALTAVLVDLSGTVVAERRAGLDFDEGPDAVVAAAAREVRGLLPDSVPVPVSGPEPAAPAALLGVGVALPGPLDHVGGVLRRVTGFPEWDGFVLREAVARRLGGEVAVVVDKDTNAAALGLALGGATASPRGSFAYLHLGTGLGAGLVLGGALYRGERTGAGEFGHQVVQLDGPECGCGNRGCIEALCLAAVAAGDVDRAARVLGEGAANLVELLDVDRVLLGGRAVLHAPERFVRGVGAVVARRARHGAEDRAGVAVAVAGGGERAVAEGAAQLLLAPLFGRADVAFPVTQGGPKLV